MSRSLSGELAEAFEAAVARRNASRIQRLVADPLRAVTPAFLRWLGRVKEVPAQTFWGETMRVVVPEPVSAMIYRFGYYDENVCRFLLAALHEGNTFVDIGAHFGFFSKLAVRLIGGSGHVVAFEPMPRTRSLLSANLSGSIGAGCASVVEYAAFDEEKTLEFRDYGDAHSSFNSAFVGRGLERTGIPVDVRARRFDDIWNELGHQRIDVMKIDAESAELRVLIGAEQSLAKYKPVVIAEFGDFDLPNVPASRSIVEWLLPRGYVAFEASKSGLRPHQTQVRYGYTNLMFVPRDKLGLIDARDSH
ncbi:FkbM family methyltransferase [Bradyrhizobium hipponense]|uniref:FkbM family methyltransferase n=1 Tax=Bradyrhizobium hipponense TaxID=2605638 RepID=A0A5S4YY52_9BRAD|nr:FkbM family methyltransferase [Bradyrhizobium hipponense]TYO68531.1 FkbM family methyltransferase [Bradyrhizobium hipponense]